MFCWVIWNINPHQSTICLASLNKDYHEEKLAGERWNRDSYNLRLHGLKKVEPIYQSLSYFDDSIEIYEAQFNANGCTNIPPSWLSELYCIYFSGWKDKTKVCKCVCTLYCLWWFLTLLFSLQIGITFGNLSEGRSQQSLLKCWIVVSNNKEETEGTGWLSREDFNKLLVPHRNGLIVNSTAPFTAISCGSTTNTGE